MPKIEHTTTIQSNKSPKSVDTPKGKAKIKKVMGEYKKGELHTSTQEGPKVKSRKQAIAIALSEGRKAQEGKTKSSTTSRKKSK